MPFDGFFMFRTVRELGAQLEAARLDKISQPEQYELRLSFRSADGIKKLLISARPGSSRLHLTQTKRENPDAPPMFCMLTRKHLAGAKLISIEQSPPERVCELRFFCYDEFGDSSEKCLIFECAGKIPNIILTGPDMRIIDCVRRVNLDPGITRPMLPGMLYRYPEMPEGKQNPVEACESAFFKLLEASALPAEAFLSQTFFGLSPLICRELAFISGCGDTPCSGLAPAEKESLKNALFSLRAAVKNSGAKPFALVSRSGAIADFSFIPVSQYGGLYELIEYPSFSALLDAFYSERDTTAALLSLRSGVSKPVRAAAARLEKKFALQRAELRNTDRREELRKKADILSAYVFKIPRGASKITLPDLYGAEGDELEIPLDERLGPAQNAQKYYREYSRLKSAKAHLEELITKGEAELSYLKSALYDISAADADTLSEIKRELTDFFPQKKGQKPAKVLPQKPLSFEVSDGFTVLCGKTGRQNDELTFKTASKGDIWFHVKNAPGSHVILLRGSRRPTPAALSDAAKIAAEHSSLSGGKVPVDYTEVKNVKKIPGGKPGMVTYDKFNTIYT